MTELSLSGQDLSSLIELRHLLHQRAEVAGNEEKTAETIHSFLEQTGPDRLHTSIGGHGVLAKYKGKKDGPAVMIRCELDALPIPEANDLPYGTETPGVSHKCGHDGHMAIVAGVGMMLGRHRPEAGNVFLLFQPAEETGEGAKRVLNDEVFLEHPPDYIFALHNIPGLEKHKVLTRAGTFAAASVGVTVAMEGESSHAGHPEQGVSPAMAVAHLIQDLSAFSQHHTSLNEPAKATVIHARVGEKAFGTSPAEGEVSATLRTYQDKQLDELKSRLVTTAESLVKMYNLKNIETKWIEPFKATVNDSECTEIIRSSARGLSLQVSDLDHPFAWSEDFGRFTDRYKGAIFGLGAGKSAHALHASTYDFPDELVETGVHLFSRIISNVLALSDD
ncbi:MAG: amidohydrolase [Balneolaceae bacterium]